MALSIENLMNPRYKVIADYPNGIYKMGDIIQGQWAYIVKIDNGDFTSSSDDGDLSDYPSIFKRLEWWEERDKSLFPEYLKLVMNDKIGFVHKVESYTGTNYVGQPLYEYRNLANHLTPGCVSELEPATQEEYSQYISKVKKIKAMNSKEEILAKKVITFPSEGDMTDKAIKRNVYKAMDEYAEIKAQGFAEWIVENNYNPSIIKGKYYRSIFTGTLYTTSELYSLFLDSLKK